MTSYDKNMTRKQLRQMQTYEQLTVMSSAKTFDPLTDMQYVKYIRKQ